MLIDMQQPISCGGVAVFPGDIIVADMDGVVVIPAGLAEAAAAEGLEQERLDAWQLAEVKRGVALPDIGPLPKK
jgi:regulator of RNase E activity RraA